MTEKSSRKQLMRSKLGENQQPARGTELNTPIESRAAVADGAGNFSITETRVEAPIGDEVLVQIKAAGICHTDIDVLSA